MRTRLLDLSEGTDANSRGGGGLLSNTDECVEAMRPSCCIPIPQKKTPWKCRKSWWFLKTSCMYIQSECQLSRLLLLLVTATLKTELLWLDFSSTIYPCSRWFHCKSVTPIWPSGKQSSFLNCQSWDPHGITLHLNSHCYLYQYHWWESEQYFPNEAKIQRLELLMLELCT